MTAPNLTPAEALECLRDKRAVDRGETTSTAFYDKWGTLDHALWRCIAALETLLSEHEATKAKLALAQEELAQANMRLASWPNVQAEPAAAVPSASEGVEALQRWFNTFRVVDPDDNARFLECIVAVDGALTKAAAAVPSDEEIAKTVNRCRQWQDVNYIRDALVLLAKRIGVKL